MNRQLFSSWFTEVFVPNCGQRRPVLLLLDNHGSHISLTVLDKARENDVRFLLTNDYMLFTKMCTL